MNEVVIYIHMHIYRHIYRSLYVRVCIIHTYIYIYCCTNVKEHDENKIYDVQRGSISIIKRGHS